MAQQTANWSYIQQESSCMNARGILTIAYQVLHVLSCPRGVRQAGPPGWGTPPILTWLGGVPRTGIPLLGVHPPGCRTWLGPPKSDLTGDPPTPSDLAGVTPPPGVDRQTDMCQNITYTLYHIRGQ